MLGHAPPPLVTDPAECTRRWERPVYEPTQVLPVPPEEPPFALLLTPVKASPPAPPARHVLPPPPRLQAVEPSVEVELHPSEAAPAGPDRARGPSSPWSWLFMAGISGALGVASWLAAAHFGFT